MVEFVFDSGRKYPLTVTSDVKIILDVKPSFIMPYLGARPTPHWMVIKSWIQVIGRPRTLGDELTEMAHRTNWMSSMKKLALLSCAM